MRLIMPSFSFCTEEVVPDANQLHYMEIEENRFLYACTLPHHNKE